MTRFDAADPTERRKLFAEAVRAHRKRGSQFLTVEAEAGTDGSNDSEADGSNDSRADGSNDSDADGSDDAAEPAPWVQFAEKTFNLDCTDEEFDRLEGLLGEFPEFRIDELNEPEAAAGTNVRISARSDAARLAGFVDRVFVEVYGRAEDYRAWVVAV